ncbi:M28-family zinc peptidase [Luteitalea sp. TBR-22]|uniref:M28 family peptidase n=1 Tax=Luteitalea sp. TBR-22 TaxID=2802971 RepID=UPI001AF37365|nr:M28 family peptidase [Luteitalea sp. TBR-22]BCS35514.1 M28-family zinc peptidase [Luteitalea sp. TBR-22]
MPSSTSLRVARWTAVLSLALSPGLIAQDVPLPDAVRAAADGITAASLARDLEFLASDALRGRDTGSPGFDAAAADIEGRLRAAGLTPAGDEGTYRQHYELQELHAGTNATVTIGGRPFVFGNDFVLRSFAGPIKGHLPVVYVGHGWRAPSRGIDPWKDVDVRDALVLAHGPRAMPKDAPITQIGRVAVGASSVFAEAKARGALGVLLLTPSDPKADWAAMRGANVVRRELVPAVPSAYAAVPVTSLLLGRPAIDALMAGEAIDGATLLARGEAGDYPRAFRLRKRIAVHVPLVGVASEHPYNLVARIEGSDPVLKDQVITIAAHLDGAVGTRTIDGDPIYNAADDNATGSAGLLAIAEHLMKGPRPRRTIVLLWDSGEERGLWGTRRFVHQPPVPLDRIVAHVNVDMIGATRAPGRADANSVDATGPHEVFLIGPGALSPSTDALLQRVNAGYLKMTFNRRDDRPESEFFYPRTDAGPYLERGILTIGFTTGSHPRYHLPADEAKYLDPAKMEAVTRTVFASLWALANSPERPRIETAIPATVLRAPAPEH